MRGYVKSQYKGPARFSTKEIRAAYDDFLTEGEQLTIRRQARRLTAVARIGPVAALEVLFCVGVKLNGDKPAD